MHRDRRKKKKREGMKRGTHVYKNPHVINESIVSRPKEKRGNRKWSINDLGEPGEEEERGKKSRCRQQS